MSDTFYNFLWYFGSPAFLVSSSPVVINAQVTKRPGAFIVAANHQSPYDIPLLMRHVARNVDFVSIVEVFKHPLLGWFYGSMNAFPLDRAKPDSPTVRTILDRLKHGRVIGMFPEGRFRVGADSVVHTGIIKPGVGRIANLSAAPVIPCVITRSSEYRRFTSWLPFKHTRYGIAFGDPIDPSLPAEQIESTLVTAYNDLHAKLADKGVGICNDG